MRTLKSASIIAVGTELTTGATRDTNSGDLARELTALGVRVLSTMALPDDLDRVTSALGDALTKPTSLSRLVASVRRRTT